MRYVLRAFARAWLLIGFLATSSACAFGVGYAASGSRLSDLATHFDIEGLVIGLLLVCLLSGLAGLALATEAVDILRYAAGLGPDPDDTDD